jgi:hypothetical protein
MGTMPANYFNFLLLLAAAIPLNRLGAAQELILLFDDVPTPWIEARQLTNLRMRTFIATPSARNVNSTEDPP